jgi:hypothetical protein
LEKAKRRIEKADRDGPIKNAPEPKPTPKPPVSDVTNIPVTELPIPDFLQRDRKVAEELKAEIDEQKKLKARGRIAKMKAKQAGDTRKMPLQGKAALAFINQN